MAGGRVRGRVNRDSIKLRWPETSKPHLTCRLGALNITTAPTVNGPRHFLHFLPRTGPYLTQLGKRVWSALSLSNDEIPGRVMNKLLFREPRYPQRFSFSFDFPCDAIFTARVRLALSISRIQVIPFPASQMTDANLPQFNLFTH